MLPVPQLTQVQHRVLALLTAGSTSAAAAQSVGVHRNTISNWLHSSIFRDALLQARDQQTLAWREQTSSLSSHAVAAIQAILSDPLTPAAVRLEAALAIGIPKSLKPLAPQPVARTGRNDRCPCGSGRKFKRCCMGNR